MKLLEAVEKLSEDDGLRTEVCNVKGSVLNWDTGRAGTD